MCFLAQVVPALVIGSYFSWFLCPSDTLLPLCSFLQPFSLFNKAKCPMIVFHFLYHSLRINLFSRNFCSLYWLMTFRNQGLNTECAFCCWVISKPSQCTDSHICLYMYNHIHIIVSVLSIHICSKLK